MTEVDVAVEQRFRAFIAERFPDHAILAEELGGPARRRRGAALLDLRSDRRDDQLRPRSADLLRVAGARDRRRGQRRRDLRPDARGAVHRGAGRRRLPQRPAARGDARRTTLIDALLCTGFHYESTARGEAVLELFGAFVRRARAVRRLGSAALDLCYVAAGRFDGFWEAPPEALGHRRRSADRRGGGRRGQRAATGAFTIRGGQIVAAKAASSPQLLDVIGRHRAGAGAGGRRRPASINRRAGRPAGGAGRSAATRA